MFFCIVITPAVALSSGCQRVSAVVIDVPLQPFPHLGPKMKRLFTAMRVFDFDVPLQAFPHLGPTCIDLPRLA